MITRWLERRKRSALLRQIGSPDGTVRGWHRGCPAARAPALGSSYNALYLNDANEICCRECGAVDL